MRRKTTSMSASSGSPSLATGKEASLERRSGSATDQVWYSTPSGIVSKTVSVNGRYVVTTGPMDDPSSATDDVLFVSATGADHLWQGLPDRTFRSTQVG